MNADHPRWGSYWLPVSKKCCFLEESEEKYVMAIGKSSSTHKKKIRKWSASVMKRSNALDLEPGVFTGSPKQIAASLKRSAVRSTRRKGTPFQSAMSMLNFHINRGGKGLTTEQRNRLERAKNELRRLFGKNQ